jgi:hypothetical protein
MTTTCFIMQVTHQLNEHTVHVVLPKSPRNCNAARRPLVVHLCTTRYRTLYPLLTTLPSGILLWGCVCFFCAFLCHHVCVVLRLYWPAKMTDVKEQRICIKFCFKLGKTVSEINRILKEAFGKNALGQTQTYEWFKHFKNRWISVNEEECS